MSEPKTETKTKVEEKAKAAKAPTLGELNAAARKNFANVRKEQAKQK